MTLRIDENAIKNQAEIFRALAHETRLEILHLLKVRDCSVTELVDALGSKERTGISKHLKILKNLAMISCREESTRRIYHLESPCLLDAVICSLEKSDESFKI